MDLFLEIIVISAKALLFTLEICMLIRAILSWLPIKEDNPFLLFITMVTEPIVMPVRALFAKLNWFQDIPIDASFFAAYLLLTVVSAVMGVAI